MTIPQFIEEQERLWNLQQQEWGDKNHTTTVDPRAVSQLTLNGKPWFRIGTAQDRVVYFAHVANGNYIVLVKGIFSMRGTVATALRTQNEAVLQNAAASLELIP